MESCADDIVAPDGWNAVLEEPEHQNLVVDFVNQLQTIKPSRLVTVDQVALRDLFNDTVDLRATNILNGSITNAFEERPLCAPFIWRLNSWLRKRSRPLIVLFLSRYSE